MNVEDASNNVMNNVEEESRRSSPIWTALKLMAAGAFLFSAITTYSRSNNAAPKLEPHRRLTQVVVGDAIPTYMDPLMKDLKARKKLMEETPPEEVKYWFEYTGALQVCLYSWRYIFYIQDGRFGRFLVVRGGK